MSSKEGKIPAFLLSKRDQAEGLAIFRFELEEQFTFRPGQYATLWLTHRGSTVPRPYSIASSPTDARVLEFYINLVDAGHLSPSFWNEDVLRCLEHRDPETKLLISGPKGRFLIDPQDSRDLVFVASGTGLAPFMSMIRKLNEDFLASARTFPRRSVHVIHGVSRPDHLGYREELERMAEETRRDPARRLAVTYLPTISRPQCDPSWTGLTGRAETLFNSSPGAVSAAQDLQSMVRGLVQSILRPETHAVYVCGYPGTVDNTMRLLSARGFRPDVDLKREKYYP